MVVTWNALGTERNMHTQQTHPSILAFCFHTAPMMGRSTKASPFMLRRTERYAEDAHLSAAPAKTSKTRAPEKATEVRQSPSSSAVLLCTELHSGYFAATVGHLGCQHTKRKNDGRLAPGTRTKGRKGGPHPYLLLQITRLAALTKRKE